VLFLTFNDILRQWCEGFAGSRKCNVKMGGGRNSSSFFEVLSEVQYLKVHHDGLTAQLTVKGQVKYKLASVRSASFYSSFRALDYYCIYANRRDGISVIIYEVALPLLFELAFGAGVLLRSQTCT
jgi:hypothetical protein